MINRGGIVWVWILSGMLLLSGCLDAAIPEQAADKKDIQTNQSQTAIKAQAALGKPAIKKAPAVIPAEPEETVPAEPKVLPVETQEQPPAQPTLPPPPTATSLPAKSNALPPEQWKEWPVLPAVSAQMRAVYQRGLEQGNNPYAFSVLGDCQSQPDVFMGIFDSDPGALIGLPETQIETITQFSGSFDRYSPTVKDGTTEGALLWVEWNDNKEKKCSYGETPLDCELRVHQPSIVFIHVGTHWESRNLRYLTVIIERILERGAVPVLVTKADNRELDERVNQNLALLAAEYDLPLWNFWASVQHLPNNGMLRKSDMYLSDDGVEVHRMGGLDALDAVWRAVR